MPENKEVKMGLTEEDIQHRNEGPGIAGLLEAMGDSVKPDGKCLFRAVACEKMVHWPRVMFAELVWEHISKFARNLETGELIRLGE